MFDEIEFSICTASSTRFIKHSNAQEGPFILYFKIADLVTLVVLKNPNEGKQELGIKFAIISVINVP